MNWKKRYEFPLQQNIVPGMIFIVNGTSNKSDWSKSMKNYIGTRHIFKEIHGTSSPLHFIDEHNHSNSWSMDYKFLKTHFNYIG